MQGPERSPSWTLVFKKLTVFLRLLGWWRHVQSSELSFLCRILPHPQTLAFDIRDEDIDAQRG